MNRTVIITGSSRGIGRAAAELFAQEDYNIVINYLSHGKEALELKDLIERKGRKAIAVKADVSDLKQVNELVEKSFDKFGAVDVLVNNAAIAQAKLFTDITDMDWDKMMDVNVKGVFNCCSKIVPHMIKRHSGKIINISSMWGITGASCEVHYSAAKAAVIGLTKALAKELGPSNIQVNCVAPGVIETDMNGELSENEKQTLIENTPLGRIGSPYDAAQCILFLASEKSDFITGQVLSPNGGLVI